MIFLFIIFSVAHIPYLFPTEFADMASLLDVCSRDFLCPPSEAEIIGGLLCTSGICIGSEVLYWGPDNFMANILNTEPLL